MWNYFILVLLLKEISSTVSLTRKPGRVLLISFDGLRWDYVHDKESIELRKMAERGASVSYVHNVFPTNTHPNHHSMITGLYPENHGIIDNVMYNETDGKFFSIGKNESPWFQIAEPLWNTNQKAGYKSGCCFFPACDLEIQGMRPNLSVSSQNYTLPYFNKSKTMSFRKRVDVVADWFKKDENVTFAALYFEQPDSTVHDISPLGAHNKDKDTWKTALKLVNKAVEYLFMKFEAEGLNETVNIIVTGDHGSTTTHKSKVIRLDDCLNETRKYLDTAIGFSFISIYPKDEYLPYVYDRLSKCSPHLTAYMKDKIPESLHIRNSARTAPIILLAEPGYIVDNGVFELEYQLDFPRGEHGYSNFVRDMNPAFIAAGPAFKKGYRQSSIEIVDIYQLICYVIGIHPSFNDGEFSRAATLLRSFY